MGMQWCPFGIIAQGPSVLTWQSYSWNAQHHQCASLLERGRCVSSRWRWGGEGLKASWNFVHKTGSIWHIMVTTTRTESSLFFKIHYKSPEWNCFSSTLKKPMYLMWIPLSIHLGEGPRISSRLEELYFSAGSGTARNPQVELEVIAAPVGTCYNCFFK